MSTHHIITVLLLLALSTETLQMIITPPSNETQKIGEIAQFRCKVDFDIEHNVQWEFNKDIIYTYQGGEIGYPNNNPRGYLVENNGEMFTLTIKDLVYEDGGNYTCSVVKEKKSAVLIVLGDPELILPSSTPVENDAANYTCKACFGGPKMEDISPDNFPLLKMYMNEHPVLEAFNDTEILNIDNHYCLRKVFKMTVDANMNGEQLECTVETKKPAMKAPTTVEMNVLYSVRNISCIPKHHKYHIGSTIACIAEGNPPPSIIWENQATEGQLIKSDSLNITEDMAGDNSWICSAKNEIQRTIHEQTITVIFKVEVNITEHQYDLAPEHIIILVLVVLVGIALALGIYLYRKRMYLREHQKDLEKDSDEGHQFLPRYLELRELRQKEDLDDEGQHVLDMLENHGAEILGTDPEIFLKMIKKADSLIESSHYLPIVQKMAFFYKNISKKPQEGPLHWLIQVMDEKKQPVTLFAYQEKMILLIEELITLNDEPELRNRLLLELVARSEYRSLSKYTFKWTKKFISVLTGLLKNEADPNWTMDGTAKQDTMFTAQYQFFWVVNRLLLFKSELFEQVKEVSRLFLFHNTSTDEHACGTPLHALVQPDWKFMNEYYEKRGGLPREFFKQYIHLIDEVKETCPDFCNMKDRRQRTPLQLFLEKIEFHEEFMEEVASIVELLKSPDSLTKVDTNHYNILHFLADAFPVLRGKITRKGQDALLQFAKCLTLESQTEVQNKKHQTPLHILANKIKIKDNPLQCEYFFVKFVNILTTKSNVGVQDDKGSTVMHILAEHCNKAMIEQETFLNLVKTFGSNNYNKNSADHEGHTVLHILAKRVYDEPDFGQDLLSIFPWLATKQNVNGQDRKDFTPYSWILKGIQNFQNGMESEIFSKINRIFLQLDADSRIAKQGLAFVQGHQESDDQDKTQKQEEPSSSTGEKPEDKLNRLDAYISIPERHNYIRAYQKDIRNYLMLDEEFLSDLEEMEAITHEERASVEGGPGKSEDEQLQDLVTLMWNAEDGKKYLNFLEVLAEEYEELVNLLTGGNWTK